MRIGLAMVLGVCLAAGLLASAAPARAQDDATDRARALFTRGVEHMDAGRYREAAEVFRQTLALRDSVQVRFNLASALHQSGQLGEAVEHFESVRDDRDAPRALRTEARRLLREIEPQLGSLTIHVDGDIAGMELTLDGRPVTGDRIGVPIRVGEGRHTVVARRGTQSGSAPVQIGAGESTSITLRAPVATPRETATAVAEDTTPPDDESPFSEPPAEVEEDDGGTSVIERWWFWTIIGVLVIGGVTIAAVSAQPAEIRPVQGNLDPAFLEVNL